MLQLKPQTFALQASQRFVASNLYSKMHMCVCMCVIEYDAADVEEENCLPV